MGASHKKSTPPTIGYTSKNYSLVFLLSFYYTAQEGAWTRGEPLRNIAIVVRWKIYGH